MDNTRHNGTADRPGRTLTHAGSAVSLLPLLRKKAAAYRAQSPLCALVGGEQSFSGGHWPEQAQATRVKTWVLPLLPAV
jgi:hypothetical protein